MNIKLTTLVIILLLTTSCKSNKIKGYWLLDEKSVFNENPNLDFLSEEALKSMFYLLEFQTKNKMNFPLLGHKAQYHSIDKNTYKITTDNKNQTITFTIENNIMKIVAHEKKNGKSSTYKLLLNKLHPTKTLNIIQQKIYKTPKEDSQGYTHFLFFDYPKIYQIGSVNLNHISKELFTYNELDIKGSWYRNKGTYKIVGDSIYVLFPFGTTKPIKIIDNKKLKFKNLIYKLYN